MEEMEVDDPWPDDENYPPDSLELPVILDSPVFWTSVEIWNYLLDMSKEWSKRVHERNKDEDDYINSDQDLQHGLLVIGKNDIKNALDELFHDLKFGQSSNEQKRTEKYCSDHKMSNILRLVRNFTQHCRENLPKEVFEKYFPKSYKNKQHFLQCLLEKLPTLLLYLWDEEKDLKLDKEENPLCYEFIQMLKKSLDKYAKTHLLCEIKTKINGHEKVFDIIKCEAKLYDKLYGTVVRLKSENNESFVEVIRDHRNERTKFKINAPQKIHQYDIIFGGHKIRTDAALHNLVFVREIRDLQEIFNSLGHICNTDSTELESYELLNNYIIESGKINVNGADIPLKDINQHVVEVLENLDFGSWALLLANQPVSIFTKSEVNEVLVPETELNLLNKIFKSDKKIHILTLNTPAFRTLMLKSLHYELSNRNSVCLYVPVIDVYTEETCNAPSLKENIIKYLCKSTIEEIILEKIFSGYFPQVTILLDKVDKLPSGHFVGLLKDVGKIPNIRVVATSSVITSDISMNFVEEIQLVKRSNKSTNGSSLDVAA